MDGKDEEGTEEFFSFFLSSFFLLPYPSLTLFFESYQDSPHSLSVTLSFTFTYYFYFTFSFNLPCHFTPWLV